MKFGLLHEAIKKWISGFALVQSLTIMLWGCRNHLLDAELVELLVRVKVAVGEGLPDGGHGRGLPRRRHRARGRDRPLGGGRRHGPGEQPRERPCHYFNFLSLW